MEIETELESIKQTKLKELAQSLDKPLNDKTFKELESLNKVKNPDPRLLALKLAEVQRTLSSIEDIPDNVEVISKLKSQIAYLQKECSIYTVLLKKISYHSKMIEDITKRQKVQQKLLNKKAYKPVEKIALPLSSLKAINQAYTMSPQAGNDLDDPTIQQAISSLAAEVDRVNPNRTEMDTEILKKNLAGHFQIKKDISKLYYRKPDHYEQATPNAYDDYTVDVLFNTPETSENAEELRQTKLKTLFHLSFDGVTISSKDYFIVQDKKNKYIFEIQLADEWFEKHIENPQPYYKV